MSEIVPDEQTNDYIEKIVAEDDRWKHIKQMVDVEHELSHCKSLKIIMGVMAHESFEATEVLVKTDPTDTKKIISLQARIYSARMLAGILDGVIRRGQEALKSVEDENPSDDESDKA
jgi:sensor histidine kinase regulating citrate/malate metabolism